MNFSPYSYRYRIKYTKGRKEDRSITIVPKIKIG